jgi:hypothetical protein
MYTQVYPWIYITRRNQINKMYYNIIVAKDSITIQSSSDVGIV